jgi:hypothetical protein
VVTTGGRISSPPDRCSASVAALAFPAIAAQPPSKDALVILRRIHVLEHTGVIDLDVQHPRWVGTDHRAGANRRIGVTELLEDGALEENRVPVAAGV